MRRSFIRALAVVLCLATSSVQAAYWVEAMAGPAGSCQLLRDGKPAELRTLMLLRENDRITLAGQCSVVLAGTTDDHIRITAANSPYDVPDAEPAPTALQNIEDWVVSWYNSQSEKALTEVAAVSRGDTAPAAPVLLEAVDSERNMLLAGTRSLEVRWTGGVGPYLVTLTDMRGQLVAKAEVTPSREKAVALSGATLSLPALQVADYELRVKAAESAQSVRIAVVPATQEPKTAASMLAPGVPEHIRQSYRAISLGSLYEWRFQALQIAAAYHLDSILERLVAGDFPELPTADPAKPH